MTGRASSSQPTKSASPPPKAKQTKKGSGAGRWLRLVIRRLRSVPLMLILSCGIFALGSVQTVFHLAGGVMRARAWQEQTDNTLHNNERLIEEINILRSAKTQLASDAYMEEIARCWGYVGQGERVIISSAHNETPRLPTASNCQEYRLP